MVSVSLRCRPHAAAAVNKRFLLPPSGETPCGGASSPVPLRSPCRKDASRVPGLLWAITPTQCRPTRSYPRKSTSPGRWHQRELMLAESPSTFSASRPGTLSFRGSSQGTVLSLDSPFSLPASWQLFFYSNHGLPLHPEQREPGAQCPSAECRVDGGDPHPTVQTAGRKHPERVSVKWTPPFFNRVIGPGTAPGDYFSGSFLLIFKIYLWVIFRIF